MRKLFSMSKQALTGKPVDSLQDSDDRKRVESETSSLDSCDSENVCDSAEDQSGLPHSEDGPANLFSRSETQCSDEKAERMANGPEIQYLNGESSGRDSSRYINDSSNPLLIDSLDLSAKKIHRLEGIFTVLFILLFAVLIRKIANSITVSDPAGDGGEVPQVMLETERPDMAESLAASDLAIHTGEMPSEVSESELLENRREELIQDGAESVKVLLFDEEDGQSGISPYLTITGLTDKEKRDSGFVESDFLRAAGLFLKERGISTKRIIVENAIECSAPDGMAFQARLEKQDGYTFQFILFKSLPGQYVFTLQKLDEEVQSETLATESTNSQTDAMTAGSAEQQGQSYQQTASPQPQTSAASDYDATGLTISSVPEELLNYLDNEYVFQYSLYDYLYRNGKKDIISAEVTSYTIDSVERKALIQVRLSDGTKLSVTYSKSAGSYSFS